VLEHHLGACGVGQRLAVLAEAAVDDLGGAGLAAAHLGAQQPADQLLVLG